MGTLALTLARHGHEVSGSDHAIYEPMRGALSVDNVRVFEGYHSHTAETFMPDWVVIGNVVTKENEEARAWIRKGVAFLSFPEAVRKFIIENKMSIVVAGTHGKTTTTAWVAFLLRELGANPSYLVGGIPNDLPFGAEIAHGAYSVCEGDEYDSAFFDKGPKFLHYKPDALILTSVEFDHADIYRDLDHVKSSFEKLIALLPGNGICIARYDDPTVMELVRLALCPVQTFGRTSQAMWHLDKIVETNEGFVFDVRYKGKSVGTFKTGLYGEHNLMNLLSGIACVCNLDLPVEKITAIMERFTGVRRRQQCLASLSVRIIDDFAHHPTEVLATLTAVRQRHAAGKLFALFEPRSATARRHVHQTAYPAAFAPADVICLMSPSRQGELLPSQRLSVETLAQELRSLGKKAIAFDSIESMVDFVASQARQDDSIVVMSNGDFGGIQSRLVGFFC
jgi:UDP-N-acetylmuramate: L-alanyl-gamma-D-glutamyl-meso-diaminopimelate ligase